MPTYEYECKDCGHHFEVFQSISAPKLETCPECSGTVRRLLGTGAGLLFKGSGFYQTDYRSESYKAGAKAEKKESTPSEKKPSSSEGSSSSGGSSSSKSSGTGSKKD